MRATFVNRRRRINFGARARALKTWNIFACRAKLFIAIFRAILSLKMHSRGGRGSDRRALSRRSSARFSMRALITGRGRKATNVNRSDVIRFARHKYLRPCNAPSSSPSYFEPRPRPVGCSRPESCNTVCIHAGVARTRRIRNRCGSVTRENPRVRRAAVSRKHGIVQLRKDYGRQGRINPSFASETTSPIRAGSLRVAPGKVIKSRVNRLQHLYV